ncbi:MAG: tRNA glutamyl-Q(34) synthetase GluQRS [Candidatus Sumerlaeia bacterium]|nr:tRNA glutamyl-Q(34) synthetase GluQRS [Candidatus Sumerlaeia bacterium]
MSASDAPVPVGRYAPSPTGTLHLGNLRTALAAWAFTRSRGGRFLLRIEDIDTPRLRPECEALQLRDLRLLGIEWDDEPIRQSTRADLYEQACADLLRNALAYPCFCSRKDIRNALSAPHADEHSGAYPGTCRALTGEEIARRRSEGRPSSLRLHTVSAPVTFHDAFRGEEFLPLDAHGGDFVIRRADGLHAYQLACALDDALSGVTEVLRGDDLLDSGSRQRWLLGCLGLSAPAYYHIPLMHGADGRRLSKRAGDEDLSALLDAGHDPDGVRSYLAWTLGQCELGERLGPAELLARFRLDRIPRAPAVFDPAALDRFKAAG